MSTEAQQPVQENPAGPSTGPGNVDSVTATEPTTEKPILGPGEGKPSDKDTAEAVPNTANVPKEEKLENGEVLIESKPINEGVLNFKGHGLKGLIPTKKYFWLSDGALEHKHLSSYLSNEKSKDVAHGNAAHATQTGKGLLFYAKRAEDRDLPQGILNLADVTDLAKGNFNDFTFTLHNHKYTFQALNKAERDGWLVTLEPKISDAKSSREGIVGSEGYKAQLEKFAKPTAAAGASKSRSLSRPKKASKSRERVAAATTSKDSTPAKDAKTETAADTAPATTVTSTDPTTAESTAKSAPPTTSSEAPKEKTGEHAAEAAAGAAVGAATVGATHRKSSASDEEKKNKKSQSQTRGNKRSSIFGGLLGKKEENDEKKAAKKAEKEEKAVKNEAEKKTHKPEEKLVAAVTKKEEKPEKEEKAEIKAEKALEKESKPESTGATGDLDAPAIASRVVGEPVIPANAATTDTTPGATTQPTGTSTATESTPVTTTKETSTKPNKRSSVFGGFFGRKESSTSPTTTEASPAAPTKDEPSAVSSTAPQLDNPVPTSTTEPAASSSEPTKTEPTPAEEVIASSATATASPTTPTDKRRASLFSNLGTKKEKKTATASGDELTDGETKKQGGTLSGLLRKASRAQPKKDSKAPVTDASEPPLPKEPVTKEVEQPHTNSEPIAATEGEKLEQKPNVTEGEAGSNALTKTEERPTVEATA